jgi:dihydrofolate reductase
MPGVIVLGFPRSTYVHIARLVLTHVDAEPEGDTRFPEVDRREWRELGREEGDGVAYVTYART